MPAAKAETLTVAWVCFHCNQTGRVVLMTSEYLCGAHDMAVTQHANVSPECKGTVRIGGDTKTL